MAATMDAITGTVDETAGLVVRLHCLGGHGREIWEVKREAAKGSFRSDISRAQFEAKTTHPSDHCSSEPLGWARLGTILSIHHAEEGLDGVPTKRLQAESNRPHHLVELRPPVQPSNTTDPTPSEGLQYAPLIRKVYRV